MLDHNRLNKVQDTLGHEASQHRLYQDLPKFITYFRQKSEDITSIYNKITQHGTKPSLEDCAKIHDLTPFMSQKIFTYFKKHNAVNLQKPPHKNINHIITICNKNEESLLRCASYNNHNHLTKSALLGGLIALSPIALLGEIILDLTMKGTDQGLGYTLEIAADCFGALCIMDKLNGKSLGDTKNEAVTWLTLRPSNMRKIIALYVYYDFTV